MKQDGLGSSKMGVLLIEVAKAHRTRVAAGLTPLGLHIGQELLLAQLTDPRGVPRSDLVARLQVERPTVAKMLRRMISSGMVERRRDPEDGRIWRVTVTPKGRALQSKVERLWTAVERELTANMTPRELKAAARLLRRMRDNVKPP